MPPKVVKTVRDLIFWQYAKLIARSAGMGKQYGFIMKTFKDLQTGRKSWSDVTREDLKMVDESSCAYCGSAEDLTWDHIIPQKIKAPEDCKVHEIHNLVKCCRKCNSSKGGRDVFTWFGKERRNEIPRLVEGKLLKLLYECHGCRGTLECSDLDSSGELDVMDLNWIFNEPCPGKKEFEKGQRGDND
ncbi:HNH endonuclease [candidate division WOR-3 bacterium]|nr:HNH endonuclease [candidate division WOR-3 bacterium]